MEKIRYAMGIPAGYHELRWLSNYRQVENVLPHTENVEEWKRNAPFKAELQVMALKEKGSTINDDNASTVIDSSLSKKKPKQKKIAKKDLEDEVDSFNVIDYSPSKKKPKLRSIIVDDSHIEGLPATETVVPKRLKLKAKRNASPKKSFAIEP